MLKCFQSLTTYFIIQRKSVTWCGYSIFHSFLRVFFFFSFSLTQENIHFCFTFVFMLFECNILLMIMEASFDCNVTGDRSKFCWYRHYFTWLCMHAELLQFQFITWKHPFHRLLKCLECSLCRSDAFKMESYSNV